MLDLIIGEHFDIGGRPLYEDRCAVRQLTTAGGLTLTLAVVADGVGGFVGTILAGLFGATAFGDPGQPGVQVIDERAHRGGVGFELLGARVELGLQNGHAGSGWWRTLGCDDVGAQADSPRIDSVLQHDTRRQARRPGRAIIE